MCDKFEYRNKTQRKLDEEIEVAMAEYSKRSHDLTVRIYLIEFRFSII